TFFFQASSEEVVYDGSYQPLQGTEMSAAYRSTVELSHDVRAGLLIRQMHHWAALIFLGAIVVHLCRIFFTGAFRAPREANWWIGLTMLVLGLANGFTGYSLPDDLLSGTGLRVAYSIATSIPLAGPWLASLFFGGPAVGDPTTGRLYIIHVLLVPGILLALVGVHLAIVWRQKHTQFPGKGRTEDNVVGTRMWPVYAMRSIALLLLVSGVIAALGGLVQINPVWLYGPYSPAAVSTAAQPDWYLGWTEGALRLMPSVSWHVFGHRVPEVFLPGVVLPGLTFALLYAWPLVERRLTGDHDLHHILDRPRDRPWRTTLGATVLAFYVVLMLAGAQDLWATLFGIPVLRVRDGFRLGVLVVPVLVGAITAKACVDLRGAVPLAEAQQRGEAPEGPAEADDDDAGAGTDALASRTAQAAAAAGVAAVAGAVGGRLGYRWGRRKPRTIRIERDEP
ncbi:MAG TPA: cytochrome b, partial [Aquihabitans sp.]|nr:cytochrome b [Aquihabitans sp.]